MSDIIVPNREIPYSGMFPSNVEMFMHQIQAQKEYLKAADMMNEIMQECSVKHHDKRDEIRERLKRKLAAKK